MNVPFYIAKRYLFAKSSNNTIHIITMIACFGVVIGSLALFVILSGFSGLRNFTYSLLDYSDPDIKITAMKGKSFVASDALLKRIEGNSSIVASAKVIEERVFLQYKDKNDIAYIKGVSDAYTSVTRIDSSLSVGQWIDPDFPNTAVVGFGISNSLSMGVFNFGTPLQILVPKPGKGLILQYGSAFRRVDTNIIGVYTGSEEFSNAYVYVGLPLAQQLLRYDPDQISAIELAIHDDADPDTVAAELQNDLGAAFKVETRAQLNALTYKVINTESMISYLIFTLIVIIALFNVVGTIIMMILDKKKDLNTLCHIGLTIKQIKSIFVFQGVLLTLVGMFLGLFLGIILVFVQQEFGLFMITQNLPYPVAFRFSNVFAVVMTISVLGYLAAKLASSRIKGSFLTQ